MRKIQSLIILLVLLSSFGFVNAENPSPAAGIDWFEYYQVRTGGWTCYTQDSSGYINWRNPSPCDQRPAECVLSYTITDHGDVSKYYNCDKTAVEIPEITDEVVAALAADSFPYTDAVGNIWNLTSGGSGEEYLTRAETGVNAGKIETWIVWQNEVICKVSYQDPGQQPVVNPECPGDWKPPQG